ncbi:hypothetical protein K443DRAFT_550937 [Laccaria amethystina LaAM-08-1]|uniref:Unplaced genomic scaffold K443scaffold_67, whole genome shotgun sequence n=1 Tax=Laccaria amethystina LaAM-08-1 TaxID=1095629 RepID=A0A0C9WSF5_9AGAR|nr:hypothetical protein K443DRAFT_550937 [Laccaria amethystina LaAM-08-1]
MSFPSGLYTLEASPPSPVGVGGLYATGNGVNEIVTVEPNRPPFVERQVWHIQAVLNGEEGQYTVTRHTTGSTFGGNWYPKDEKINSPVVTSEEVYTWFIAYSDKGPDTITIQAPILLVGVWLYVGADYDKHQAILKPVPKTHVPGAVVPYWHFKVAHLQD